MVDTSGVVAPVCNAVQTSPVIQPTVKPITQFVVPNTSVPSSITFAIQQLQQAIQQITHNQIVNNITAGTPGTTNGPGGAGPGGLGFGRGGGGQKAPGDWEETDRQTQNVKVVNPDDDSQFVIVKEIISITFTNSSTNEEIVIKQTP